jgi:hypothetical protein
VLAELVAITPRTADRARGQADGVGGVGHDRRDADRDQDRKAEQGGHADRGGEDPGAEARGEHGELLEAGHRASIDAERVFGIV